MEIMPFYKGYRLRLTGKRIINYIQYCNQTLNKTYAFYIESKFFQGKWTSICSIMVVQGK